MSTGRAVALLSLLLCFGLLGCETVEFPTATPTVYYEPIPTPSPTPFPTGFIDCFGFYQEGFILVNTNRNPCLLGEAQDIPLNTEDGRYVSVYPGYDYRQSAGIRNTLAYMNSGSFLFRGDNYNAMVLNLTQIDGEFGVALNQEFNTGYCYLIKQTGYAIIHPSNTDPRNIWLTGSIETPLLDYALIGQSFPSLSGEYEIFWMVLVDGSAVESVNATVAIVTHVEEAGFTNPTENYIHAIEVLIASPGQGFCNVNDPRLVTIR